MNRRQRRAEKISARKASRSAEPAYTELLTEGLAHHRAGRAAEAEALYRQVLANDSNQPDAIHFLGVLASQRNAFDEARRLLGKAVRLRPGSADIHNNLAVALSAGGAHSDAEAACRRALEIDPSRADAHYNLGLALDGQGRIADAVLAYRRAIELKPDFAAAYNNLGNVLKIQGEIDQAAAAYREALALAPGYVEARNNLGVVYRDAQEFELAIAAFNHAIAGNPDFAEAHNNLGTTLLNQGRLEEAMAACRRATDLDPEYSQARGNFLFCMMCASDYTASDIYSESRLWDERHAASLLSGGSPGNDRDPERRLRIGYVSPDFRTHAVSYFFEPLMAAHDAGSVELYCYAELANADATTARYRERADHWRVTVGLSDHEVAERVRADKIDILVDLAGHTAGNRLLAFAEHPAPVQVSHLVGYGQTTGLSAMDYLLTDAWMSPAGSDGHYSEIPYRLERCFLSFQPLASWPEITPSPARDRGSVSFGSLNSPSRITPGTIELWARILRETEGSRLLMVHGFFRDASIRERLSAAFAAHGLADRVSFDAVERGWPAGMDVYQTLDIALDTFPMASATTTAIALWMGLPVITLAGEAVHTRFGVDILTAVGAGDWVAADADSYVSRAVALAGDTDGLADLRAGLRARMAASPLLDHDGLARAVEAAYRDIWRRWCAGGSTRGRMRSS